MGLCGPIAKFSLALFVMETFRVVICHASIYWFWHCKVFLHSSWL